jgi:MarR family 2-MHQ and catechol resistance regulon transcriptional repressor
MELNPLNNLGLLIALSRRIVWMAASRRLEEHGYSMVPWVLMAHLVHAGPTTQRDIAAASGQHPAGISRLIDELQEEGLVRRRRDEVDRRRARVEVTRKGRATWEAAQPVVIGALKEALSPLTTDEQRHLQKILRKLVSSSPECMPRALRSRRRAKTPVPDPVKDRPTKAPQRKVRAGERQAAT